MIGDPQRLHAGRHKQKMKLSPDWVVGFVDGEGCFFVGIQRNVKTASGFQVIPEFRIIQHERDVQVLHALKAFFGCGQVRTNHGDRMELRVRRLEDLESIARFFEKRGLKTKKNIDFLKFRDVLTLMGKKAHLDRDGLIQIAKIAGGMNTGNRKALMDLFVDDDIVHAPSKEEGST